MRTPRLADFAMIVGLLSLTAAIGDGQYRSAKARERRDPLLWQLQIFDADGHLVGSREMVSPENQPLEMKSSLFDEPRLKLALLPLGLPDGGLDVQLHLSVNGAAPKDLRGFHVAPGETVHLAVPGQAYHLALRVLRLDSHGHSHLVA